MKVIKYYLGKTKIHKNHFPFFIDTTSVLLNREEENGRLIGWTIWVDNSFITKQKTITNSYTNDLKMRYKTSLFKNVKEANQFYLKNMNTKNGIVKWKRK